MQTACHVVTVVGSGVVAARRHMDRQVTRVSECSRCWHPQCVVTAMRRGVLPPETDMYIGIGLGTLVLVIILILLLT